MKSNEWYTPAKYIEAARSVMGGIDLDPASCELANRTVKATRYYTKEENGLMQPWYGRVWLNPPYGRTSTMGSNLKIWTEKLIHSYRQKAIEQAVLLIPANTDTAWFLQLWDHLVCFPPYRIKFYDKSGKLRDGPSFDTCFVYLGGYDSDFIDHFSPFGPIVKAITQPKPRPLNLELFTEDSHV